MFKKIIWATDFSQPARNAGKRAFQCAKCSEGSLSVVVVVDPDDLPNILSELPIPFKKSKQVIKVDQELEEEYLKRVLNQVKEEIVSLEAESFPFEIIIRVGKPWREIVRVA